MPAPVNVVPLSTSNLSQVAPHVPVPGYDRTRLRPGIVHIGVGGFHRAHLAAYIDQLATDGNTDWSIVGAGVMEGDAAMAKVMEKQDCLYTLVVRSNDTTTTRVIGSIVQYLHAFDKTDQLAQHIAAPTTHIVSLTVTEGGYPVDDTTGLYSAGSPTAGPQSAFGIIAAGLAKRRANGTGGITVLSCDNIMSNGEAARTATLGEADQLDHELSSWIEANVAFPNSMVDRITPATTDSDRKWLIDNKGVDDAWPVVTEPFLQWVVEDKFAADRLPLEDMDVIVTHDVEPYERMKLQLLNASHSCLAYLAALLDIEHVDVAMAQPVISNFVRAFLDTEAGPVVPPVAGINLDEYNRSLVERFSNAEIADQVARLCLDGTAKFPKFLLPTVKANLAQSGPTGLSALALAGWCHYLNGTSDSGENIQLSADPLLDQARHYAQLSVEKPAAFLDFVEVFGTHLPASPEFVEAFSSALSRIRDLGVASAITTTLGELPQT